MKQNCQFYYECRLPTQLCNNRCKQYKPINGNYDILYDKTNKKSAYQFKKSGLKLQGVES